MEKIYTIKQKLKQPPSLNTLFRSIKGRSIKSKAYREYIDYFNSVSISHIESLDECFYSFDNNNRIIKLTLKINFRRINSDIDNYLKCLLDCCHEYYYKDDKEINSLTIERLTNEEAESLKIGKGECLLKIEYMVNNDD